jgi:hypothetical protein
MLVFFWGLTGVVVYVTVYNKEDEAAMIAGLVLNTILLIRILKNLITTFILQGFWVYFLNLNNIFESLAHGFIYAALVIRKEESYLAHSIVSFSVLFMMIRAIIYLNVFT